jgi:hypothetical protein
MKKAVALLSIVALLCFFWQPQLVFADSIAEVNSNNNTSTTFSSPYTALTGFSCSGTHTIIEVYELENNGDIVTGISDGGTALSGGSGSLKFNTSGSLGGTVWQYVFYLYSPPSSGNIVVTTSSNSGRLDTLAVCLSGAQQSGFPDAVATGNGGGSATSESLTVTPIGTNDWVEYAGYANGGSPYTWTSPLAERTTTLPSGDSELADTNGTVGATSFTGKFNQGSTGTFGIGGIEIATAPYTAAAAATFNFSQFITAGF